MFFEKRFLNTKENDDAQSDSDPCGQRTSGRGR